MRNLITMLLCLAVPALAQTDDKTGLALGPGVEVVSVQCTVCHSARLITQNRADRDGWLAMIRWMQESQGLWPLGAQEELILDYLATYYGAKPGGRRQPLPPSLMPE